MKTPPTLPRADARTTFRLVVLAGCSVLAGCATESAILGSGTTTVASDTTHMTQSGFLSDDARLKPTSWGEASAVLAASAREVRGGRAAAPDRPAGARLVLVVGEDNAAARAAYQRLGFVERDRAVMVLVAPPQS